MSFEPHIKTLNKALELDVFTYTLAAETGRSSVYRLVTKRGSFALRFAEADEQGRPRFEADAAVREHLGAYTARPLMTSTTNPVPDTPPWSLDSWCEGRHAERGELPPELSRTLGEVLLRLHALPCSGYGRLENKRSALRGEAETLRGGLESRFQEPFIFDSDWSEHPVAKAAPKLLPQLSATEPELRSLLAEAETAPAVVLHSDLHEGQFLLRDTTLNDKTLSALLDFGDASVGPATLDLASFAYFHGFQALTPLLTGYGADTPELRRQIDLYTILIALHQISRAYTLERPSRRSFAVLRLRELFERLT